jgi:hypothetical protein
MISKHMKCQQLKKRNYMSKIILVALISLFCGCSAVDATGDAVSHAGRATGRALGNASESVGDAVGSVGRGAGEVVAGTGDAIQEGAENTRKRNR